MNKGHIENIYLNIEFRIEIAHTSHMNVAHEHFETLKKHIYNKIEKKKTMYHIFKEQKCSTHVQLYAPNYNSTQRCFLVHY